MLDRPGHIRGGVEDAHWGGGYQLASTVGEREVPIILEGGLALDCPEAPEECVRTHSRAASAIPYSRYHGCDILQLSSHDRRGGERIANQRPAQLGSAGFSSFQWGCRRGSQVGSLGRRADGSDSNWIPIGVWGKPGGK